MLHTVLFILHLLRYSMINEKHSCRYEGRSYYVRHTV